MKFRIPEKFKMGTILWKVEESSGIPDENSRYGETLYLKQTVRLSHRNSPDQTRVTFLHEAIHVMDHTYKLHIKEDDVCRLAQALAQLLEQLECDHEQKGKN